MTKRLKRGHRLERWAVSNLSAENGTGFAAELGPAHGGGRYVVSVRRNCNFCSGSLLWDRDPLSSPTSALIDERKASLYSFVSRDR